MISSAPGFRQSVEELCNLYSALGALRAEHPEATPRWLAVMGEGFLDQARRLQQEIEEYVGAKDIEELSCPRREASGRPPAPSRISRLLALAAALVLVGGAMTVSALLGAWWGGVRADEVRAELADLREQVERLDEEVRQAGTELASARAAANRPGLSGKEEGRLELPLHDDHGSIRLVDPDTKLTMSFPLTANAKWTLGNRTFGTEEAIKRKGAYDAELTLKYGRVVKVELKDASKGKE
jgi:hypothetical protein